MQSNNPLISIIIPYVRPEGMQRCVDAARRNAGIPREQYEILAEEDTERIGCPRMVKRLTDKARGEMVCFLGDDTEPSPGFLMFALSEMEKIPDGGLVGLNDGGSGENNATHWLAHKNLLPPLDGEFFHTGYVHCFCDNELVDRCKEMGRYRYAEEAKISHFNPVRKTAETDADYERVYSRDVFGADRALYLRRRIDRQPDIKLGIGLPLTWDMVHRSFFITWVLAIAHAVNSGIGFTLYGPKFPGRIEDIRNQLAEQALNDGCTHLLMCDTDQTYPIDTIVKLVSHDKPVVAGVVHRRYKPFEALLYKGTVGHYKHLPDDLCYSGDLVEVDATGTGCILYDTHVFLDIPQPWFEIGVTDEGKAVGEDVGFCHKLKQAGYPIHVDTSLQIGHLALLEINRSTYDLAKRIEGYEWAE